MTISPRRRGRPAGSSRYSRSDVAFLEKVADLVTDAVPALPPTAAMRKLGIRDPSTLRRMQRKWRSAATQFMQTIRDRRRRAAQLQPTGSVGGGYPLGVSPPEAEWTRLQRLRDAVDPPYLRQMRETMAQEQRLRDAMDPPYLRQMRETMAQEQRLRDAVDPPYLRRMREMMQQEQRLQQMFNPSYRRPFG